MLYDETEGEFVTRERYEANKARLAARATTIQPLGLAVATKTSEDIPQVSSNNGEQSNSSDKENALVSEFLENYNLPASLEIFPLENNESNAVATQLTENSGNGVSTISDQVCLPSVRGNEQRKTSTKPSIQKKAPRLSVNPGVDFVQRISASKNGEAEPSEPPKSNTARKSLLPFFNKPAINSVHKPNVSSQTSAEMAMAPSNQPSDVALSKNLQNGQPRKRKNSQIQKEVTPKMNNITAHQRKLNQAVKSASIGHKEYREKNNMDESNTPVDYSIPKICLPERPIPIYSSAESTAFPGRQGPKIPRRELFKDHDNNSASTRVDCTSANASGRSTSNANGKTVQATAGPTTPRRQLAGVTKKENSGKAPTVATQRKLETLVASEGLIVKTIGEVTVTRRPQPIAPIEAESVQEVPYSNENNQPFRKNTLENSSMKQGRPVSSANTASVSARTNISSPKVRSSPSNAGNTVSRNIARKYILLSQRSDQSGTRIPTNKVGNPNLIRQTSTLGFVHNRQAPSARRNSFQENELAPIASKTTQQHKDDNIPVKRVTGSFDNKQVLVMRNSQKDELAQITYKTTEDVRRITGSFDNKQASSARRTLLMEETAPITLTTEHDNIPVKQITAVNSRKRLLQPPKKHQLQPKNPRLSADGSASSVSTLYPKKRMAPPPRRNSVPKSAAENSGGSNVQEGSFNLESLASKLKECNVTVSKNAASNPSAQSTVESTSCQIGPSEDNFGPKASDASSSSRCRILSQINTKTRTTSSTTATDVTLPRQNIVPKLPDDNATAVILAVSLGNLPTNAKQRKSETSNIASGQSGGNIASSILHAASFEPNPPNAKKRKLESYVAPGPSVGTSQQYRPPNTTKPQEISRPSKQGMIARKKKLLSPGKPKFVKSPLRKKRKPRVKKLQEDVILRAINSINMNIAPGSSLVDSQNGVRPSILSRAIENSKTPPRISRPSTQDMIARGKQQLQSPVRAGVSNVVKNPLKKSVTPKKRKPRITIRRTENISTDNNFGSMNRDENVLTMVINDVKTDQLVINGKLKRKQLYRENILSTEEDDFANKFLSLDGESKILYSKMFFRKRGWHKASSLNYGDLISSVDTCLDVLKGEGLFDVDTCPTEEALDMLSVTELKQLCKSQGVDSRHSNKQEMKQKLLLNSKTQLSPIDMMKGLKTSSRGEVLGRKARNLLGRTFRINEEGLIAISRFLLLHSLFQKVSDEFNRAKEHRLFIYSVHSKDSTFVDYIPEPTAVFLTRQDFLDYEEALNIKGRMQEAKKDKNQGSFTDEAKKSKAALDVLLADDEYRSRFATLPEFLTKFSAACVHAKNLTAYCQFMKTDSDIEFAYSCLMTLIKQKSFNLDMLGVWVELMFQIQLKQQKPLVAGRAILWAARVGVEEVDRLTLQLCASRLIKMKKYSRELEPMRKDLDQFSTTSIREPESIEIKGNAMSGNQRGSRLTYERENESGTVLSTVEEEALFFYRNNGFPYGVHDEGRVVSNIFHLFFFDLIYSKDTKQQGVFQNKYQKLPLDFYCADFYENRKENIEKRLAELASWTNKEISEKIHSVYSLHRDKTCAMQWKYPPVFYCTLIECIGMPIVQKICERFARVPHIARCGFPDLTLWNSQTKQCKFVEVKSPNDRLSVGQRVWMDYLKTIGADCEVCNVKSQAAPSRVASIEDQSSAS